MIPLDAAVMLGSYNHYIVVLSALIAVFASYTALDLAGRVTAALCGSSAALWPWGLGFGPCTTPPCRRSARVPVLYHWPTVLLSLLAGKLSDNGNLLVENRNGLILTTELFQANGTAEREAALAILEQIPGGHRATVGADKGYGTAGFVAECRNLKVTPHVAQNIKRSAGSAIDARTTRHDGYGISQTKRKRIEESFGWLKTIALMRKVRHRGIHKVE